MTTQSRGQFANTAMKKKLLEKDEEIALAKSWLEDKDEKALEKLILAHGRLVVSNASKFRFYGLSPHDLIQEGNIGLMEAANRFDYTRDIRFSTYATWWIRSYMQDFILRNWSIVRTGTTSSQKSLFFNLRRLRSRIEEANREELGDKGRRQIAKQLGVKLVEVEKMENRLNMSDQSLNMKCFDDSDTDIQDLLVDETADPELLVTSRVDGETRRKYINLALDKLSEREQTIVRQRRLHDETITLEELGRRLGISKERVRQLEVGALSKMHKILSDTPGLLC